MNFWWVFVDNKNVRNGKLPWKEMKIFMLVTHMFVCFFLKCNETSAALPMIRILCYTVVGIGSPSWFS